MPLTRAQAIVGIAAAFWGFGGVGFAADLPSRKSVDVVPVAVDDPSAVHGYVDFTVANTRVTGGGFLLYPRGSLFQTEAGLSIDLYKSKSGFINSVSIFGGAWSESWSSPPAGGRHWQEVDYWGGLSIGFAEHFNLSTQFVNFQFPAGGTIRNFTAKLSYDDSHLGLPITINPYVNLFYNYGGLSAMPMGQTGSYRVDIGINPTYSFKPSMGVPLTISAPTWIALAPTNFSYVNIPANRVCGPGSNLVCSTSAASLLSTGLQARYSLEQIIPKKFGSWYVKGGVQYYHLINEAVIGTQVGRTYATFPAAKRDIAVLSGGFGVSF
jgi:hypothetical protein